MLKVDADGDNDTSKKLGKATAVYETYDITGAIPAGTYDVEVLGRNSSGGSGQTMHDRYCFYVGEMTDENKVSINNGKYSDYGFVDETSTDKTDRWTTPLCQVTIAEGATSISVKWIGSGHSAYINGLRLVTPHQAAAPATGE